MKPFDTTGYQAALLLLDEGMAIKDIAKHPSTKMLFSYHLQAKKMILKMVRENQQREGALRFLEDHDRAQGETVGRA